MAIRLGGLASGLDTQSIIETLLTAARRPLTRLEQKQDQVFLKKSVFQGVEDKLLNFRRSLLELRLESTFRSKTVASSDESYASATATVDAEPGTHVLEIAQVATPAVARSLYTRTSLVSTPPNTADITSVSGRPTDNLEGTHEISVADLGDYFQARSEFRPNGGGQIRTLTGTAELESGTTEGTIGTSISSSNNKLNLDIAGETIEVTLENATADVTTTSRVAADIEDKINEALNTAKDTQDVTYVAVRASRDDSTDTDKLMLYDLSGSTSTPVVQTTANSANETLGFGTLASPSGVSGTSTKVVTDVVASSTELLLIEINEASTGLIRGVSFASEDGLSVGEAVVHTNADLNTTGAVPSVIYGGSDVATSAPLATTISGLDNAGFADEPSSLTNGTFTINDVRITISDYESLSVNDVLGLINGSEAGVTATYEAEDDRFLLTSNENNGIAISLGAATDTSNFLTIANLTANEGATNSAGSFGGGISTGSILSDAGFSVNPTSGTFTINGVSLYVNSGTHTVENLIGIINNSSAKVVASYDTATDKFSISSKTGTVITNGDKIEFGAEGDTSNLLRALNLVDDLYAESTSTSTLSGARTLDTVTITPTGSSTTTNIYIPETQSTGAYQATAGAVNWVDGIAGNAVFQVLAGDAGSTAATWTNPLSSTIANIDTFVSHWNTAGNWSGGFVEVGVIKEGPDSLRFFNRSDGSGGSGAGFSIAAPSAFDLFELGLSDSAPPSEFEADSDTIGLWHFNEGQGTTSADASGNGSVATQYGASWESGSFMYDGMAFDGTDDYVSMPASGSTPLFVDGNSQMTLELWIDPSTVGTASTIVNKGGDGFELAMNASGYLEFSIWTSAGQRTFTSDAALSNDNWYKVTATYNGDTSTMGMVVGTTGSGSTSTGSYSGAGWGTGVIVDSGNDLYVGSDSGTASFFEGQLDELRISDIERTASGTGSWSQSVTNSSSSVEAEYNALTFAYAVNRGGTIARAKTDGAGGVTLYSTEQGYGKGFTISDESTQTLSTINDYFGSSSVSVAVDEDMESGVRGRDAAFSVDGINYTRSTNSVTDVLGGVTLNLHSPTTSSVTISIANDTDRALDSITTFVVQYNEMLEKLDPPQLDRGQIKYLDPLSDDEKNNMTIYEYEEYQGYHELYNEYQFIRKDGSLRLLYQSLRRQATSEVDGLNPILNGLSEIGITPGSVSGFEDAKEGYLLLKPTGSDDYEDSIREYLSLNSDLMDALRSNADRVYDLFAAEGSSDTSSDVGIARQMDTLLGNYVDGEGILDEQTKIQGSFDKELLNLSERIETEETRLANLEERLWAQFTAMEEQISRLNQQSSSVTALLQNSGE